MYVRLDTLQQEQDRLLVEVATLRAQVVMGGEMDDLRWMRIKMEDLCKRVGFYRRRYHAAMLVDYIEHYSWPMAIGIEDIHTRMHD